MPPSAADLLGLDGVDTSPFTIAPLSLNSFCDNMTPNTSWYPEPHTSALDFFQSHFNNNETPWTAYQNVSPSDIIMSTPTPNYLRTVGSKRQKIHSDSGVGTHPSSMSSAPNHPSGQVGPRQIQTHPSSHSPSTTSINQDDFPTPRSQERRPRANSSSALRNPSPSGSQQSPPRSAPKLKERHFCDRCKLPNSSGFSTTNDLARHKRGVHGIFEHGEKIWRCRMEGCTCANKIWPRRDNFQSHLKRMHFNNDDNKARDAVDQFQEAYDVQTHGPIDSLKTEHSRGSRARNMSASMGPPASLSITGNTVAHQLYTDSPLIQKRRQFNQHHRGAAQNNPWSASSPIMQQGDEFIPTSNFGPQLSSVDPGLLTIDSIATGWTTTPRRNRGKPRGTLTAPPNPDTRIRHKREIEEENRAVSQLSQNKPATGDLNFTGQFNGYENATTPNQLLSSSSSSQTINLSADLNDPEQGFQELREKFKDFSPAAINLMKMMMPAETWARLSAQTGQLEESNQSPDSSKRSVPPQPPRKKKADDEKTLKCDHVVEQKGDKKGTAALCGASFKAKSELRKHKKRHDKRFGCTFDHCYSKFGTKWEWKRHEHSQHLQEEAWRCRIKHCQELHSDKEEFKKHLKQHHSKADMDSIAREVKKCWLAGKWLGSYWCGYCKHVVRSEKEYGREMDDERLEHIGAHVLDGCKSLDWVELAGNGKTKKEMKEIDERGGPKSPPNSTSPSSPVLSNRQEEEEDDEEDDDEDESDGDAESEAASSNESDSAADSEQQRVGPPSLEISTTLNSSVPPSSHGSRTGPLPNTPTIHVHTPEGLTLAEATLENVNIGSMYQSQGFTNNSAMGYLRQMHLQQLQQPHLNFLQASSRSQRSCCQCESCANPRCQHIYCDNCLFSSQQPNFPQGGFSSDDGSRFGMFGAFGPDQN